LQGTKCQSLKHIFIMGRVGMKRKRHFLRVVMEVSKGLKACLLKGLKASEIVMDSLLFYKKVLKVSIVYGGIKQ